MNFCPVCGMDGLMETVSSPEYNDRELHVTVSCRYCGAEIDRHIEWEDEDEAENQIEDEDGGLST